MGSASARWMEAQAALPKDRDELLNTRPDDGVQWLRQENLWRYTSRQERKLLEARLSQWTEQDVASMSWRTESLGVLLWSLRIIDSIPPYDTEVALDAAGSLPLVRNEIPSLVEASKLRSPAEIEHQRDLAELWHWRSRTTQLQRSPSIQLPGNINLDEVIHEVAEAARAAGDLPKLLELDFPAFNKPYRELDEDEYGRATSIAMERHYAFNWLCGYAKDWDSVPTPT